MGEGLGWEGPVGGAEPQPTAHAAIRAIPHRIIPQKYWYRPNRPMTTLLAGNRCWAPDVGVGTFGVYVVFLD